MKKVFFMMSFALMAVFVVSCSNDSEELFIQQTDEFTVSDIAGIKAFQKFAAKKEKVMRPVAVKAIKRNRANTRSGSLEELSLDEMTVISQNLAEVGQATVELLTNLGADMAELDEICPIEDNLELYGMIGFETLNALDVAVTEDESEECEIISRVDWVKAGICVGAVFGVDASIWGPILSARVGVGGAVKNIAKSTLFSIIKSIGKEVQERALMYALGGTVGLAIAVGQWAFCYFDGKEKLNEWLSGIHHSNFNYLPLQNLYNTRAPLPEILNYSSLQIQGNTLQMCIPPFDIQKDNSSNLKYSFSMT